jgi:hypothetical protein
MTDVRATNKLPVAGIARATCLMGLVIGLVGIQGSAEAFQERSTGRVCDTHHPEDGVEACLQVWYETQSDGTGLLITKVEPSFKGCNLLADDGRGKIQAVGFGSQLIKSDTVVGDHSVGWGGPLHDGDVGSKAGRAKMEWLGWETNPGQPGHENNYFERDPVGTSWDQRWSWSCGDAHYRGNLDLVGPDSGDAEVQFNGEVRFADGEREFLNIGGSICEDGSTVGGNPGDCNPDRFGRAIWGAPPHDDLPGGVRPLAVLYGALSVALWLGVRAQTLAEGRVGGRRRVVSPGSREAPVSGTGASASTWSSTRSDGSAHV